MASTPLKSELKSLSTISTSNNQLTELDIHVAIFSFHKCHPQFWQNVLNSLIEAMKQIHPSYNITLTGTSSVSDKCVSFIKPSVMLHELSYPAITTVRVFIDGGRSDENQRAMKCIEDVIEDYFDGAMEYIAVYKSKTSSICKL